MLLCVLHGVPKGEALDCYKYTPYGIMGRYTTANRI